MITLYKFGPAFGLPDASPFCIKAELLLKMAGLDYETNLKGFNKAPYGKLPYINDDGETIADSSFIAWHIASKYGHDFNANLSARDAGVGWAVAKMCDEQLYWVVVYDRWVPDHNFEKGPKTFFTPVPALIRPLVIAMVRRGTKKSLKGHGIGRLEAGKIHELGRRGVDAVSDILGDRKYMLGDTVSLADASVYAMLHPMRSEMFETPMVAYIEAKKPLAAYLDRMTAEWFPDFQ